MNSNEFYLWLNGYLEALESEEIKTCKISSIREKMKQVKHQPPQERVIFGPNIQQQQQQDRQTYVPKPGSAVDR